VSAELVCAPGHKPALKLAQKRYLPQGSTGDANKTWQIPVCAEYGVGAERGRVCKLVTTAEAELELVDARRCPDWVLPNDEMAGYFRVDYQGHMLDALFKNSGRQLSLPERVGLVSDMSALVDAGRLSKADALARVPTLLKDRNRHVVSASAHLVGGLDQYLVPAALRANYARFVRKNYGKLAQQLGYAVREHDDDDTRLLRPTLVALVADEGQDARLIREAGVLARKFLVDRKAVDPTMVEVVLHVAAQHGDAQLWQQFHDRAKARTTERKERDEMLEAMGSFVEPELVKKNLGILLTDEFELRDALTLMQGAFARTETRELGYEFVKANYDAILRKLPPFYGRFIPLSASAFCDEAHAKDAEAFFAPRMEKVEGGPRMLEQALEQVRLCSANREAQEASVAAFLKKF